MSEWWVGRQGSNPVGPVTTDTLIRGILEQKVPEDSLVCRVGEQHWQHIAQVDELWEQVHPEQFQTNVTQRPWFAEKGSSQPPVSPPVEPEIDDESTRIFAVPILPMRTVGSSPSNPLPARAAFPPATGPTTTESNPGVNAGPPAKPTPGLAASPAAAHTPSTRPIISPPRFGLDRSSPANRVAPVTVQALTSTTRTDPGVAKPQTAPGPSMPSAPQPVAASPNRPGIAIPQPNVPAQAPAPIPNKAPTDERKHQAYAESDSVPLIATRPRLPSDPQPNSRPLSQTRPDGPAAQQHAARPEAHAPKPFAARPALPTPQPIIPPREQPPPILQRSPIQQQPPIQQRPLIQPQPPIQPRPPIVAPSLANASAPRTTTEPEEDTVTVITQSAAAVAKANAQVFDHPPPPPTPPNPRAPAPAIREVEPADLFDEDFEPVPSRPVAANHSAAHVSVAPRPAAGTPAPPSVIVSHPPPSMADIALSHAVASVPEETRPALRSMRPPGTIQVTIGTLVIGALTLVVLVLLVVLLLH